MSRREYPPLRPAPTARIVGPMTGRTLVAVVAGREYTLTDFPFDDHIVPGWHIHEPQAFLWRRKDGVLDRGHNHALVGTVSYDGATFSSRLRGRSSRRRRYFEVCEAIAREVRARNVCDALSALRQARDEAYARAAAGRNP